MRKSMSDRSGRVVVDSSVAMKWFIADEKHGVAEASELRDRHLAGECIIAAPSHVILEVLNALWSKGAGVMDLSEAADWLVRSRFDLVPVESLAQRAGVLAAEHRLTVYDAAFVALAESLDAELVTADRRLAACGACRTRLLGS
jgi:predicted nucleic acid-binding protein